MPSITTHGIARRDPADRVDEGDSGMFGDGVKGMDRVKRRVSGNKRVWETLEIAVGGGVEV